MVWMSCSPFDFVGEAKGKKQARQGDQAAVWCTEWCGDTEAGHASEEGEDIAFQIHPCPGAELGEHLLQAILIPHSRKLSSAVATGPGD